MTLHLVSHPLPAAWDGRRVDWDRWESSLPVQMCPPPKDERCACGSSAKPYTARGLRHPTDGDRATADDLPRVGRRTALVWAIYNLHAFRCPDCGQVDVWDMASNEWWTLDESDYGPAGSVPPPEWAGGLLDLLNAPAQTEGDPE